MKKLALLLTFLALPGLLLAWQPDTRIHFVDFQDSTGHHVIALDSPVSRGDAIGLRTALFGAAMKEQANGRDAFLRTLAEGGSYTDNGHICHITTRSGGRIYFCGQCGGLGCASVKAIQ